MVDSKVFHFLHILLPKMSLSLQMWHFEAQFVINTRNWKESCVDIHGKTIFKLGINLTLQEELLEESLHIDRI